MSLTITSLTLMQPELYGTMALPCYPRLLLNNVAREISPPPPPLYPPFSAPSPQIAHIDGLAGPSTSKTLSNDLANSGCCN